MKKLYKAPVMIIVKMKPHAIMQASNGTLDSGRSIVLVNSDPVEVLSGTMKMNSYWLIMNNSFS